MFYYCFLLLCDVFFVSFVVFLLYCLSHHLQGRVHDYDPMGGHDSDSSSPFVLISLLEYLFALLLLLSPYTVYVYIFFSLSVSSV